MTATIADVRKFWDARPCNLHHSPLAPGTAAWCEEVTRRKYFVEPHIREFAQFAKWKGKEVLEIGCGIGTDTLEFARAGAIVCAQDISLESAEMANQRIWMHSLNATVFCENAEQWLPLGPEKGFDLIYSFGVLHHTPNPGRVLKQARARLADDGEMRIMLYAARSLKFWFDEQPEAQAGCPIARTYTGRQARRLLEDCGFEVVSMRKAHIFPWRLTDYVHYRYVRAWPWKITPEPLFRFLERILGHHLLIVARKA